MELNDQTASLDCGVHAISYAFDFPPQSAISSSPTQGLSGADFQSLANEGHSSYA